MNMAFAVSASFALGEHPAFALAFDEGFMPAMIAGELISGITAFIAARFVYTLKVKK